MIMKKIPGRMKIGIIGFGNMGSAISEQLKSRYEIIVFDQDKSKTAGLTGINAAGRMQDLVGMAEVLILAVKPQDFDSVLRQIKGSLRDTPVISIAAGISTNYIERILGKVRVVRAMPNIGVKIGESVTCLAKGAFATDGDLELVQELFYYLGRTKIIEETMMNAATAISGSGPAYIFDYIAANSIDVQNISIETKNNLVLRLEKAAESIGFNHEDAVSLAVTTTASSLSLVKQTKVSPLELKKQVTSKGGTTEAGLAALERTGSWEDAARAALKRAEELSK
ncbi:pyrroline-5-carboxylate reductase [bacterium]|nr:MAG: pyrroline-5-carboxylate reductase [bacterium]